MNSYKCIHDWILILLVNILLVLTFLKSRSGDHNSKSKRSPVTMTFRSCLSLTSVVAHHVTLRELLASDVTDDWTAKCPNALEMYVLCTRIV
jgi:hypothetical protein